MTHLTQFGIYVVEVVAARKTKSKHPCSKGLELEKKRGLKRFARWRVFATRESDTETNITA